MLRSEWIWLPAVIVMTMLPSKANAQFGGLFRGRPAVKEISATQLRKAMTDQAGAEERAKAENLPAPVPRFILVDVRSPEEYAVSMIPGAITRQQFERNQEAYKGRIVIPYCTIGGRSGNYASTLAARGVKVLNFKGSILKWCEHQYPLVTPKGESTNRVHVYSSRYRVPGIYRPVW